MPGHRPAPLHTAPPPGARPRRRRAQDGVARLLAWPPPLGLPPGVGDIARGGLGRESQASTTALARGGAGRPGEATQAPAPGGLGSARQAAACRAAEPRLGAGLPVRPDRGRAGPEAAQHRRRAHAVHQWADGSREPSADVQRRLRIALQAAAPIAAADSAAAQAWFQGPNPQLGDRSPLRLLREGDLDEVGPEVIGAARAFLAGG